ncbi:MAG: ABC transporter ATP-binding protein [Candidatus Rokubacteria bacterium]|nr:ABC transporter ATP-binding protein [Candidatus Rokubacteria bacterium]
MNHGDARVAPAAAGGFAPEAVSLDRVSVAYGGVAALKEVSLDVRPGEMLALLGPSGCGKTSLLRTIAGFVPHTGDVHIGGRRATGIPSHRRNIGMVFQDYALFPHMTIAQNVGFGLRMRKVPRREIDTRVEEAIALVGLRGVEHRLPRQLSGGQQQRVAVARAIVIHPSVLLLDEPLSALDKKLREEMEVELRLLQKRVGITTIFVTHDQEEALAISDRIAVMHEGRVLQLGCPEEIYDAPAHPFVAGFVGKANRLSGTVTDVTGDEVTCELAAGVRVRLATPRAVTRGDRLQFTVRPEKIVLAATGGELDNSVEGKVRTRIYLGMFTELRVQIPSGDELTVVVQNTRPAVIERQVAPGDAVVLAWSPHACRLLE